VAGTGEILAARTKVPNMSIRTTVLPGQDTLLASWGALAQLSPGARVIRSRTTDRAVFPSWMPLNNAILLNAHDAAAVASQLTSVYADAGVDVWALWMPSSVTDLDAPDAVLEVGDLKRDTTTLVMQAALTPRLRYHNGVVRTSIATATRATDEPVPAADLGPPDRVPALSAWVMVHDDLAVAGAWSFLHRSDCGIYAVGTVPDWRRRGFARSLMEHVLADAQGRGARTATLQSTRMGQPLYESLGFEPVGRYEEWISQ
jgi:GNAT superfamily N-acetyltransferase